MDQSENLSFIWVFRWNRNLNWFQRIVYCTINRIWNHNLTDCFPFKLHSAIVHTKSMQPTLFIWWLFICWKHVWKRNVFFFCWIMKILTHQSLAKQLIVLVFSAVNTFWWTHLFQHFHEGSHTNKCSRQTTYQIQTNENSTRNKQKELKLSREIMKMKIWS